MRFLGLVSVTCIQFYLLLLETLPRLFYAQRFPVILLFLKTNEKEFAHWTFVLVHAYIPTFTNIYPTK
jgi:hypothetical protein